LFRHELCSIGVVPDKEVRMSLTFSSMVRKLPDEVWNAFEPVLPPVIWKGNGRPPYSNRICLQAAIFILTSGTPWEQMPPGFPCGKTVRLRLKGWFNDQLFVKLWSQCVGKYQRIRGINFDQISIDGARKPSKKGIYHRRESHRSWQMRNAGGDRFERR
jgi:transposase